MNKKVKIGIDLNEVIRNRFLNFDKYYYQEFGEDGIPENNQYVYDFFSEYKWVDSEETIKYLRDDAPEEISPIDYHNDGNEKNADSFLFQEVIEKKTAIEKYNEFMYKDFCYEIHGLAPMMYKNQNLDIHKLMLEYGDIAEFILISDDNELAIPSTLFFLSKNGFKFKNIKFLNSYDHIWNDVNVLITSNPNIIKKNLLNFNLIKVIRPYNEKFKRRGLKIIQIDELLENKKFSKKIMNQYDIINKSNNKLLNIVRKLMK